MPHAARTPALPRRRRALAAQRPVSAAATSRGRPAAQLAITASPGRRRALALLTATAATATLLTGCASTVSLESAPDATDPACADVIVRLPDTVAGEQKRTTDAQATGAWGDPASVLLHCGVPPYGPTTLPCGNVNGVDWIVDDSNAPTYVFTTYGRTPAVEVVLDYDVVGGTSALDDLRTAVQSIPQEAQCLDADDVLSTPTATPAP